MPGRSEVLDDMIAAIRQGQKPLHDGRWGKANVEVALAILRSARERREVMLEHQVAVPTEASSGQIHTDETRSSAGLRAARRDSWQPRNAMLDINPDPIGACQ